MSNRWTMKEMENMDIYHFAACILSERRNNLNPYSPLAQKLAEAIGALEKLQADTPSKAADAREFKVETPLGTLRAYAKQSKDEPENFPGVYIDLLREGESQMLTCVEYESNNKELQTTAWYVPGGETEPDVILHHSLEKEDDDGE